MSDPRSVHKFCPNRKGKCTFIVKDHHCGEPEEALVHQRWEAKERKAKEDDPIARLTAERDRLREALVEIAEGCKEPIQRTCDDCLYDNYAYCNEYSKIIARKALEEK